MKFWLTYSSVVYSDAAYTLGPKDAGLIEMERTKKNENENEKRKGQKKVVAEPRTQGVPGLNQGVNGW